MHIKSNIGKSLPVLLIIMLLLLPACTKTPTPEPVISTSLPVYPFASEMTAAAAAQMGVFFSPYGFKGSVIQNGPYKGYEIESTGDSLSGIRFFSLQSSPGDEISAFFDAELSKNGWIKGKDIREENIVGSSWTRGNQAFAIAYPPGVKAMVTLLLNK